MRRLPDEHNSQSPQPDRPRRNRCAMRTCNRHPKPATQAGNPRVARQCSKQTDTGKSIQLARPALAHICTNEKTPIRAEKERLDPCACTHPIVVTLDLISGHSVELIAPGEKCSPVKSDASIGSSRQGGRVGEGASIRAAWRSGCPVEPAASEGSKD
jgi:hypothetical protein